jgi:NAD+ synthase (glutamine-hydrolysing)
MKIALAQLNYHIGNFEGNLAKMLEAVEKAKSQGADLIAFGELATCGYPPRDFLEFDDFIRKCYTSVESLARVAHGIAIVVGSPSRNPVPEGKDLYNSAWFLADGDILHVAHKALLPTYDIFDEYRYFEIATEFHAVEFKGHKRWQRKSAVQNLSDGRNDGRTARFYAQFIGLAVRLCARGKPN